MVGWFIVRVGVGVFAWQQTWVLGWREFSLRVDRRGIFKSVESLGRVLVGEAAEPG